MSLQKDGSIQINGSDFLKGQAASPHTGLATVRNLELIETPGVAKIQKKTASYRTVSGLPVAMVKYGGYEFVLTENGYFYKDGVEVDATLRTYSGNFSDAKAYKDYIIVTGNAYTHIYGPVSSASAQFFHAWNPGGGTISFTQGYRHQIVIGQDNIVYITNGNTIGALSSFVAGAPTVAPTATWNSAALTLQDGHYGRSMIELGKSLAIGSQGGSSSSDFNYGIGTVFFWDRSSTSFGLPNQLQESGVHQMVSLGGELIAHAGIYGNLYRINPSSTGFLKKIPYNIDANATINAYPNAIAKIGNEVVVGTSTLSDAYPTVSTHGVWSVLNGNAYLRNTISSGNIGTNVPLSIGCLFPLGTSTVEKNVYIGWKDGTSYGLDGLYANPYPSYAAFFESELYQVGSRRNPKTYEYLEVALARPLISGQYVRVSYRKNLTDDYTVITTLDYTTTSVGKTTHLVKALIADAQFVQLKVELSQDASVASTSNVQLREIRLS